MLTTPRHQFDILDGSIDAFTVSPRVGYRFTTPGIDKMHLPSGKLNVWVGSMYQDVQQEFKGKPRRPDHAVSDAYKGW
ncbi:Uncharacterised protein [Salmonella enterica subsp. enterica]|uniref:Uncharacterized protein n=1 Tax=Salmonella enterica I TaxID=59201 RepID=A0A447N1G9_SALET|nr:Uncharacterised protein [Salmonella enterica subsp. enterica]